MVSSTLETPLDKSLRHSLSKYRRFLIHYLAPQKRRVLGMGILLLGSILVQLVNPQVIRYFLDTAQSVGRQQALLLAAGLFIAFALLQQVIQLAARVSSQRVSWAATNQLRTDLVRHCLSLDMPFHKEHTPGELIERIDGDAGQLANFFSQFIIRILSNSLLVLGILLILLGEDPAIGLGMAAYTLLTLSVLILLQRPAARRWAEERQASAEQYGYIEECISGAEELRAAGAEAYALRKLTPFMRQFLSKIRAAFVVSSLTWNLSSLIYVVGYAAGLALGVTLYLQGRATLGTAYLVVYYVGMLAEPLQHILEQAQDFQQASASLSRLWKLLDLQPQVPDPVAEAVRLPSGALGVAFRRVFFSYEQGENVLEDVSFAIQPGQVLGILGRTGSGKSTISRLLIRLYDPAQGSICLADTDLRRVPLADLRQRVGMVTQDVQLFEATVRENLTFFDESISATRLEEVLRSLRLWEWAQALPQGLDTKLSGGSLGLSAGEAQLLAFGRVFLKDPGLVILDEASSRLDPLTETLMEQAVDQLFAGRTAILIAHRLKTVQRADRILILENGGVAEFGARQSLADNPHSRFYSLLQTGLEDALA